MSLEELFKRKLPTPDQMYTLLRFVEEGSLSAAFGKGKSDQAAATQKLARIDAALSIRTRKKSGSYKIPTDEAKELAEMCRSFFQKLEDFKTRSEGKPDNFVMGAGDSLTFYLFIPALLKAGQWRRSVEWRMENLRSRQIVSSLLNGSIDVGLVRADAINAELVQTRRLKQEKICRLEFSFFVRRDFIRGYRGKVSDLKALMAWGAQNLPLAAFWHEESVFTTALEKARIDWPTRLRCSSFPQVKEAVLSGGYCGILPTNAVGSADADHLLGFGGDLLKGTKREIVLVWSSSLPDRRHGGEKALGELRTALKNVSTGAC